MRGWLIALLFGGCSFAPGAGINDGTGGSGDAAPPDDSGSSGTTDASGTDATMGDAALVRPPCGVTDNSLVWCLELDEPGLATATTALDSSGNQHDPTISNIAVTTRSVPASSQAITTSATSTITMPKPSDFNVQTFTITAWIRRTSTAELGIVDTTKQYTLSIDSTNQTVECAIANPSQATVSYTGVSLTGNAEWDLVACTYDGTQVCTFSFRNGSNHSETGCAGRSQTTATNGTTTSVGAWTSSQSHFIGSLDQVRIYNRALTEKQICQSGGLSGC